MSDTDASLAEEIEAKALATDDSSYDYCPVHETNVQNGGENYEDDVDDDDWGEHSGNSDLESDTESTRHGDETSDEVSDNESEVPIPTHTSYDIDESCNGSPTEPDDDVEEDTDTDTNYALTNSKLSSLTVTSHPLDSDFVAETDYYDPSTNGSELTSGDEENTCDISYKYETGIQIQHNDVRPLRNMPEAFLNQSSFFGAADDIRNRGSPKPRIELTSAQCYVSDPKPTKNMILPFIGIALVGGALAYIPNLFSNSENHTVLNLPLPSQDAFRQTKTKTIRSTKDMYSHWYRQSQDFAKLLHR